MEDTLTREERFLLIEEEAANTLEDEKAVVLLSGGQDSMTVLAHAITIHGWRNVMAIGFDYGQRHEVELICAENITSHYGVPYELIEMPALRQVGESALTGDGAVAEPHSSMPGVPASFVPARNAIFLTLGFSYAQMKGAKYLYGGMCQTDYSGYPDCRRQFVDALAEALYQGYVDPETGTGKVEIRTPLMYLDKAQTFQLALLHDALEEVIEESHTCYEGERNKRHEWGYGCGVCPACQLRKKGWEQFIQEHNAR